MSIATNDAKYDKKFFVSILKGDINHEMIILYCNPTRKHFVPKHFQKKFVKITEFTIKITDTIVAIALNQ